MDCRTGGFRIVCKNNALLLLYQIDTETNVLFLAINETDVEIRDDVTFLFLSR